MNKRARLNVEKLIEQERLKFGTTFRIRNIKELAEIEFGANYE